MLKPNVADDEKPRKLTLYVNPKVTREALKIAIDQETSLSKLVEELLIELLLLEHPKMKFKDRKARRR